MIRKTNCFHMTFNYEFWFNHNNDHIVQIIWLESRMDWNISGSSFLMFILFADTFCTGKSLSEALILASTNPQYDNRLFIELQVQYVHENSKLKPGENMLCTEIVSDIQYIFYSCTQLVLPMYCKKKSFWQRFTFTWLKVCLQMNVPL